MTEYGRIHTDGSRSGGQPVLLPCPVPWCEKVNPPQVWSPDYAPMYTVDCPDCGLETDDFPTKAEAVAAWNTRQPTQSDALLEGDAQTILYLLGVRHGREDERAKIVAERQAGYAAGVEAAAKALEADAMKCDCAALEERECGCGAWCEWKSITSARAVEIVRELKNVPPPEGDGDQ